MAKKQAELERGHEKMLALLKRYDGCRFGSEEQTRANAQAFGEDVRALVAEIDPESGWDDDDIIH